MLYYSIRYILTRNMTVLQYSFPHCSSAGVTAEHGDTPLKQADK